MGEILEANPEILTAQRVGYDIDDTLVWRNWAARFLGRFKSQSLPEFSLADLPTLERTPVNKGGVEPIQYFFQPRRAAIPGALDLVRLREKSGVEQFAITGRPATIQWHEATVAQLKREGFPIPEDRVLLTPLGRKTYLNKAIAIRELGIEEYSDDDLRTILINSLLHPGVIFNWIQHPGTAKSRVNQVVLAARSNVVPIPINVWAQQKAA